MILNIYTIVMLFIAVLTGLLAVPLAAFSLGTYRRTARVPGAEQRTALENRAYLLMLTAGVILFVKLLVWPFFYVTLQSYIFSIEGAMCIFGVTKAQPVLSGIIQVFKPIVFFAIGSWLLINRLDRAAETSPLFRRKFLLLSVVSLMIFIDSLLDLFYFTGFDIKTFVSCCTTFFDLPERATSLIPSSLFGEAYAGHILPLYFASGAVFMTFHAALYARLRSGADRPGFVLAAGVLLSVINAVITVFALFELIAPRAMDLPLHHCIYCMWQYEPHSILMTASFLIGTFAPGWMLVLYLTGRHEETALTLGTYLRRLSLLGIGGIGLSVALASFDLFL